MQVGQFSIKMFTFVYMAIFSVVMADQNGQVGEAKRVGFLPAKKEQKKAIAQRQLQELDGQDQILNLTILCNNTLTCNVSSYCNYNISSLSLCIGEPIDYDGSALVEELCPKTCKKDGCNNEKVEGCSAWDKNRKKCKKNYCFERPKKRCRWNKKRNTCGCRAQGATRLRRKMYGNMEPAWPTEHETESVGFLLAKKDQKEAIVQGARKRKLLIPNLSGGESIGAKSIGAKNKRDDDGGKDTDASIVTARRRRLSSSNSHSSNSHSRRSKSHSRRSKSRSHSHSHKSCKSHSHSSKSRSHSSNSHSSPCEDGASCLDQGIPLIDTCGFLAGSVKEKCHDTFTESFRADMIFHNVNGAQNVSEVCPCACLPLTTTTTTTTTTATSASCLDQGILLTDICGLFFVSKEFCDVTFDYLLEENPNLIFHNVNSTQNASAVCPCTCSPGSPDCGEDQILNLTILCNQKERITPHCTYNISSFLPDLTIYLPYDGSELVEDLCPQTCNKTGCTNETGSLPMFLFAEAQKDV